MEASIILSLLSYADIPLVPNKPAKPIFSGDFGRQPRWRLHGVEINGFTYVGNYAIRIQFSDGHSTGIFSWDYLAEIAGKAWIEKAPSGQTPFARLGELDDFLGNRLVPLGSSFRR